MLREVTHAIDSLNSDRAATLDSWSDRLQDLVRTAVEQGGPAAHRLKDFLNGMWLGHPLHPVLTDVTVGAWSTGALLDLVNGRGAADAAITVGVLSAVPTALAGMADWSDTEGAPRRQGLVHALLNSAGLTLMIASLFARRGNQRALGIGLSTLGLSFSTVSAWIGGHLVYALGSSVNRQAFEPSVDEFQVVARFDALVPDKPTSAKLDVQGETVSLVLVRKGPSVLALGGTCTHWGGPLAEGKLVDGDCIECPWHASQFSMTDGHVRHGPASVPSHSYDVRINNGNVEVRRRV